jgi:hypothetical protein
MSAWLGSRTSTRPRQEGVIESRGFVATAANALRLTKVLIKKYLTEKVVKSLQLPSFFCAFYWPQGTEDSKGFVRLCQQGRLSRAARG